MNRTIAIEKIAEKSGYTGLEKAALISSLKRLSDLDLFAMAFEIEEEEKAQSEKAA